MKENNQNIGCQFLTGHIQIEKNSDLFFVYYKITLSGGPLLFFYTGYIIYNIYVLLIQVKIYPLLFSIMALKKSDLSKFEKEIEN